MEYLIIGYIATAISIVMYAPQTIKVLKERKCTDVNIMTFFVMANGALLWSIATTLQSPPNLPGFVANLAIALLTLPIMYYYFINRKKVFLVWLIWVVICLLSSIIFVIFSISLHDALTTTIVIAAGVSTGFGFIPQSIRVMKTRRLGDISRKMVYLVILANLLWVIYYITRFVYDDNASTYSWYTSCVFTVFSFVTPMPIIIFGRK